MPPGPHLDAAIWPSSIALSPNGYELRTHLRGNESEVRLLDHLKAGAGLLSHSEGVDPIDLQQLADARMSEAIGTGAQGNANLGLAVFVVRRDSVAARLRPDVAWAFL